MHQGKLRAIFCEEDILAAMNVGGSYTGAAQILSAMKDVIVSRQLVRYWVNIINAGPSAVRTEREEAASKVRGRDFPSCLDIDPQSCSETDCILFIPDLHSPYQHPHALDFLAAVKEAYKPTHVICGGDECDYHAMSMHDSDPNLDAAGPELMKAREVMRDLATIFPKMVLVHSNHGSLYYRRAKKFGIPVECLKDYIDVLFPDAKPDWVWKETHKVELPNGKKLLCRHGDGVSKGQLLSVAAHEGCNLAIGHFHSDFNLTYAASSEHLYWAATCGSLVDPKALAFAYGKNIAKRPILGCMIVKDSIPTLIPMLLKSNGHWCGEV